MIVPSLLGCAVFKLSPGGIKVCPQSWNDWGNLYFQLTVPANYAKQNQRQVTTESALKTKAATN